LDGENDEANEDGELEYWSNGVMEVLE